MLVRVHSRRGSSLELGGGHRGWSGPPPHAETLPRVRNLCPAARGHRTGHRPLLQSEHGRVPNPSLAVSCVRRAEGCSRTVSPLPAKEIPRSAPAAIFPFLP